MRTIKLNSHDNSVSVKHVSQEIQVKQVASTFAITTVARGLPGVDGQDGQDGQDGADDKYYEAVLSNQTSVTITHNLGKYPSVTVFDSAGDEVEGDYRHLNINQTLLTFSAGFSGKAIFN